MKAPQQQPRATKKSIVGQVQPGISGRTAMNVGMSVGSGLVKGGISKIRNKLIQRERMQKADKLRGLTDEKKALQGKKAILKSAVSARKQELRESGKTIRSKEQTKRKLAEERMLPQKILRAGQTAHVLAKRYGGKDTEKSGLAGKLATPAEQKRLAKENEDKGEYVDLPGGGKKFIKHREELDLNEDKKNIKTTDTNLILMAQNIDLMSAIPKRMVLNGWTENVESAENKKIYFTEPTSAKGVKKLREKTHPLTDKRLQQAQNLIQKAKETEKIKPLKEAKYRDTLTKTDKLKIAEEKGKQKVVDAKIAKRKEWIESEAKKHGLKARKNIPKNLIEAMTQDTTEFAAMSPEQLKAYKKTISQARKLKMKAWREANPDMKDPDYAKGRGAKKKSIKDEAKLAYKEGQRKYKLKKTVEKSQEKGKSGVISSGGLQKKAKKLPAPHPSQTPAPKSEKFSDIPIEPKITKKKLKAMGKTLKAGKSMIKDKKAIKKAGEVSQDERFKNKAEPKLNTADIWDGVRPMHIGGKTISAAELAAVDFNKSESVNIKSKGKLVGFVGYGKAKDLKKKTNK